jgi:subtilisin family serine protease
VPVTEVPPVNDVDDTDAGQNGTGDTNSDPAAPGPTTQAPATGDDTGADGGTVDGDGQAGSDAGDQPVVDDAVDTFDEADWDGGLERYGDENVDRPITSRAIVQLLPGIDPGEFAARYDATVIRAIASQNIVLLGIGDELAPATPGIETGSVSTPAPEDSDEDRTGQPAPGDAFYNQYNVRGDRRADMNALANDPDVLWVEFNFTSRAPEGRPRYFFTSSVAQPKLVDAPALPQGLKMQSSVCATGNAITVAVLDTGVDTTHPAIADNILDNRVNMLEISRDVSDAGNGIDDDGDGRVDEMVGHGTHVAGTVVQVAPDAQILPVKVLDSDGNGDTFSVMAGVVYAVEQGADVINLSLGSTWDSTALAWAVRYAEAQGVVVIAAAGNGDREAPVEYPASDAGAISVAATDGTGDKASYSNYNGMVDISAPGDNVASAYPGGVYATASGTSMSAPLVSGTAALMLERSPDMTPQSIHDRVVNAAAPLSLSNPVYDGKMGGGELDVNAALVCGG